MNRIPGLALAAVVALILLFPFSAAADCPPGTAGCPLAPPQSVEVNPDSVSGEGNSLELQEPGALLPVEIGVPMPMPAKLTPAPLPGNMSEGSHTPANFETLDIPMRYQGPGDVTCGVQSLGMAMAGLGAGAPVSSAMVKFLEEKGMMYDFGTGVEELAYAAQSFGYKGSFPVHGWSLEDLKAELGAGRSAVVSLGTSGEGQPGHFVTVTGVSPDGKSVSYNDPTLGKRVISAQEFSQLWSAQGNSGVVVRKEAPSEAEGRDLTPWVALAAGLMAAASQAGLGLKRKGIGGRLLPGGGGPSYRPSVRPVSHAPYKTTQGNSAARGRKRKRRQGAAGAAENAIARIAPTANPRSTRRGRTAGRGGRRLLGGTKGLTGKDPSPIAEAISRGSDAVRNFSEAEVRGGLVSGAVGGMARRAGHARRDIGSLAQRASAATQQAAQRLKHKAGELVGRAWIGIKSARSQLKIRTSRFARGAWSQIRAAPDRLKQGAVRLANGAWRQVSEAAARLKSGAGRLFSSTWNSMRSAPRRMASGAGGLARRAWSGLKVAAGRISASNGSLPGPTWRGMKSAAGRAIAGGRALSRRAWSGLTAAAGRVKASAGSLMRRAWSGVSSAARGARGRAGSLWNAIKILPGRFKTGAGSLWSGIRNGVSGLKSKSGDLWGGLVSRIKSLRQSPTNPSFRAKLSAVSGGGALLSMAGNIGYSLTGRQGWSDAAGVGDVISGGASLVGLRGTVMTGLQRFQTPQVIEIATTAGRVAQVLGKAAGVLSAVTGAYTAITEGKKAITDYAEDRELSKSGQIAAINAASGVLATFGGVMLITPLAPVGGVFLAASSILTAGSWIYQNWDRVQEAREIYRGVGDNAKKIMSAVGESAREGLNEAMEMAGRAISQGLGELVSQVGSVGGTILQSVSGAASQAAQGLGSLIGQVLGR